MEIIKGRSHSLHIQSLQIGIVGIERGSEDRPLRLLPILSGAVGIFGRVRSCFKQVQASQVGQIHCRILRQLRHRNLRNHAAHQIPFKGIVIQKYHRIHADVQRLLNCADIAGLILPIGNEHGEVLQAQYHLRMLLKGFLRRPLVVLAAHRQKDPPIFQFLQPCLKIREGMSGAQFSDLDAAQAIIPNNAAPKGIVQVNDDTLFHRAPECLHNIYHLFGSTG